MPVILKKRIDGVIQRFNVSPLRPKIIELYNSGLSSRAVGKECGISHARVLQLLEKDDVKRRSIEKPIINSNYKDLTTEKAYVLGVMCGDGCLFTTLVKKKRWTYRLYAINLMVIDLDFAQEFSRCLNNVYGLETKPLIRNYKTSVGNALWMVSTKRKAVFNDLNKFKFGGQNWEIPNEIMNSGNKELVASFLRGFFDSEGSVSIGKRGAMISVYSANKKGLESIRKLILRYGINASELKEDRRSNRRTIFYLYITHRNNYIEFLKHIGFTIKRKENKIKSYLEGLKYERK